LSSYKLGIIGCGNMGEAIIRGVLDSNFLKSGEIMFYEKDNYRKKHIKHSYKVYPAGGIIELVKKSRYVLLSVKPQDLGIVLEQMKSCFNYKINSIISVVAGVPTDYIEKKLSSNVSVIRVMPNTPALFKRGIAAISKGRFVKDKDLLFLKKLIKSIGDYVVIEEKYQNIATALSGSGPAYFFLFCKYLIESGIKNGLNPEISKKLVTDTMIGAGITIEKSGIDLAGLIEKVASPGGTTESALKEFERNKLGEIIYAAVESAKKRAYELQNFLD
jgi:pyrroline-5-carboxylate reductase